MNDRIYRTTDEKIRIQVDRNDMSSYFYAHERERHRNQEESEVLTTTDRTDIHPPRADPIYKTLSFTSLPGAGADQT